MYLCKIIQDPRSFKLSSKRREVTTSFKKGKVVDLQGRAIKNIAHQEVGYQVICVAQLKQIEHIKKVVLKILAGIVVALTFGMGYFCSTKIRSLLKKKVENKITLYVVPHVQEKAKQKKVEEAKNIEIKTISTIDKQPIEKIVPPAVIIPEEKRDVSVKDEEPTKDLTQNVAVEVKSVELKPLLIDPVILVAPKDEPIERLPKDEPKDRLQEVIVKQPEAKVLEVFSPLQCHQTIRAHRGTVKTLVELKDGHVVSGSSDFNLKIWNKDWKCIQTLEGHKHLITSVIELQNGHIASTSCDKTIKIWNRAGECLLTIADSAENDILIELKDGLLAAGSKDNTIKIWTLEGVCLKILQGHKDWVRCLIELQDGNIASGACNDGIKIWSREGNCLKTFDARFVNSLIELKDGSLANGTCDKINIFNRDGEILQVFWKGLSDLIPVLIELQNGPLACASGNSIKIWSRDGQCLQTLEGHQGLIQSLIELNDGRLVSGSNDGTIKIWGKEIPSQRVIKKIGGKPQS